MRNKDIKLFLPCLLSIANRSILLTTFLSLPSVFTTTSEESNALITTPVIVPKMTTNQQLGLSPTELHMSTPQLSTSDVLDTSQRVSETENPNEEATTMTLTETENPNEVAT